MTEPANGFWPLSFLLLMSASAVERRRLEVVPQAERVADLVRDQVGEQGADEAGGHAVEIVVRLVLRLLRVVLGVLGQEQVIGHPHQGQVERLALGGEAHAVDLADPADEAVELASAEQAIRRDRQRMPAERLSTAPGQLRQQQIALVGRREQEARVPARMRSSQASVSGAKPSIASCGSTAVNDFPKWRIHPSVRMMSASRI